jgi:hypothetical protein
MHSHQLANPLFAHTYAACKQLFPHARPTVFALDLRVNRLDVCEQCLLAHAPLMRLVLNDTLPSLMKAAGAYIKHFAQHRKWPVMAVAFDRGVFTSSPSRSTHMPFLECRALSSGAPLPREVSTTPFAQH